ncbi:hypothetical protein [Flavobacterium aquidurense]|uniref:hypothetical protein n=1 Tax=Flavobacterium aquidurense TaxID=362413 RepID=UPI0037141450
MASIYIGFTLSPILEKESLKDISFSDFKLSIGPFLSSLAVLISYRTEIKKEKSVTK